ncbi:hypothetical protein Hanom_Chr03g00236121 [Helianthus anomalus]
MVHTESSHPTKFLIKSHYYCLMEKIYTFSVCACNNKMRSCMCSNQSISVLFRKLTALDDM